MKQYKNYTNYFNPIQELSNYNIKELNLIDIFRIGKTKKHFAVITDEKVHLTNNPKRLVAEKYTIYDAYSITILDLNK